MPGVYILSDRSRTRFRNKTSRNSPYVWKTFDVDQLSPVTAAIAAHGVTNKFENLRVLPLADSDEFHALFHLPPDLDLKKRIYFYATLISNAAAKATTLTVTYDALTHGQIDNSGVTASTVGDGATAVSQGIDAVAVGDNPGANKIFDTMIGYINPDNTSVRDWQSIFFKVISSANTTADAIRVIAFHVFGIKLNTRNV